MKNIVLFYIVILLSSCAHNNKEMENSASQDQLYEIVNDQSERKEITIEEFASQKLKDYMELLKLQMEYPEFKEDIMPQLDNLSKENLFNSNETMELEEVLIQYSGEIEKISDSVDSIKFYVTKKSDNGFINDSIAAYITTSKILVDGKQRLSRNIIFNAY